jgi:hypothetical protein
MHSVICPYKTQTIAFLFSNSHGIHIVQCLCQTILIKGDFNFVDEIHMDRRKNKYKISLTSKIGKYKGIYL